MTGLYTKRVKTLATFECLGETFRVCWPRYQGKQFKKIGGNMMVIVHGEHWMYTAHSPWHQMTVETAIARFQNGAKAYIQQHNTEAKARKAMLRDITKMKEPRA